MMDGVSWSSTRAPESFSRSKTTADTLSRLASFIARADSKQQTANNRQQPSMFVCQECGSSFPYVAELLHHQEVEHTLPKPHRCPSCGQAFSLRSSLQLHKCKHDSSPCDLCPGKSQLGSRCPACTTRSSDPGRLKDKSPHRQPHLEGSPSHLDGSPYTCALCRRGFSQKQALLHHQQAACSEPPSLSDRVASGRLPDDSLPVSEGDLTPGPSSRAVNVCHLCSKMFRTEAGLQRHEQSSHAEEQLKSRAQGTSEEGRKESNIKENGDLIKMPKSKTKLLDCRSCNMVFRSTSKLYVHRKEKHSREKCILGEPRPVARKRRRGGSYPCQVCGKVFVHHLSLRAHYRQHTAASFNTIKSRSPPVGCTTKDTEFSENRPNEVTASIAEHKPAKAGPGRPRKVGRLETKVADPGRCREVPEEEEDEREFPCPSCAEVFSLQSRLKEHVELHQSSVRRRHCSVCTDEMDTRKWPGSRRQRLYHCVPCQQGFSALDLFLEHCQEHLRVKVEEDRISESSAHQAGKA